MHDPHAKCFLTPISMMHIKPNLAHLMHGDMFIQLLLAWASESAHCCFLASAAVATPCQYLY
ncbi:hypothetical protein ID866_10669 [Astraeus odoratus]|nr:hypothetical protein ID866_10669 [Astraeus odoratus]